MKIRQLLLLIVHAIVSVLYFYSTQIRISFTIFLEISDFIFSEASQRSGILNP